MSSRKPRIINALQMSILNFDWSASHSLMSSRGRKFTPKQKMNMTAVANALIDFAVITPAGLHCEVSFDAMAAKHNINKGVLDRTLLAFLNADFIAFGVDKIIVIQQRFLTELGLNNDSVCRLIKFHLSHIDTIRSFRGNVDANQL